MTMTARFAFLSLLICALLLSGCGGGGGTPSRTVGVENASGAAGAKVAVHIRLVDRDRVGSACIALRYDPAKLQPDIGSVRKGLGIPVRSILTKEVPAPGVLEVTITGSDPFTGDDLFVVEFTILSPSPHGARNEITIDMATLLDVRGRQLGDPRKVNGYIITD